MEEVKAVQGAESSAGEIEIANEVIKALAGLAAKDVNGVAGMGGSTWDDIVEFIGRRDMGRGVEVRRVEETEGDEIDLEMDVVMEYGVNLPTVAGVLQKAVKTRIEEIAGTRVRKVNVRIVGLRMLEAMEKPKPRKAEGAAAP